MSDRYELVFYIELYFFSYNIFIYLKYMNEAILIQVNFLYIKFFKCSV